MSAPRERLPGERVFALLVVLFSAFMLWSSFGISGFKSSTSAGAFPMAASATMLVCALIALVQTLKMPAAAAQPGESTLQHLRRDTSARRCWPARDRIRDQVHRLSRRDDV